MVVIIDDREDVWSRSPNLLPVLPYEFFVGIGDINATFLPTPPPPPGAMPDAIASTSANKLDDAASLASSSSLAASESSSQLAVAQVQPAPPTQVLTRQYRKQKEKEQPKRNCKLFVKRQRISQRKQRSYKASWRNREKPGH